MNYLRGPVSLSWDPGSFAHAVDTIESVKREQRTENIGIRVSPTERQLINERADDCDLSLTEYIVRAALGELADPSRTEKRLGALEERLDRLERVQFEGSF
jgi:uncharacterized protein (DUF1778 family)